MARRNANTLAKSTSIPKAVPVYIEDNTIDATGGISSDVSVTLLTANTPDGEIHCIVYRDAGITKQSLKYKGKIYQARVSNLSVNPYPNELPKIAINGGTTTISSSDEQTINASLMPIVIPSSLNVDSKWLADAKTTMGFKDYDFNINGQEFSGTILNPQGGNVEDQAVKGEFYTSVETMMEGKSTIGSHNKVDYVESFTDDELKTMNEYLTEEELWQKYFTERSLYLDTIVINEKTGIITYRTVDGKAPGYWRNYPEWFQKKITESLLDSSGSLHVDTLIKNKEKYIADQKSKKIMYTWLAGIGGTLTALAIGSAVPTAGWSLLALVVSAPLTIVPSILASQNDENISKARTEITELRSSKVEYQREYNNYLIWKKKAAAAKEKAKPSIEIIFEDADASGFDPGTN